MTNAEAKRILKERDALKKKKEILDSEWYTLRSLLGNDWAIFYFLLGGREAGKSYAVTDFYVNQWKKRGRPFYWLRLTEASQKKLLNNNAEKLIDPDLRRKYKLDIVTRGDGVYEVRRNADGKITDRKLMARVLALSTFYNDKGSGLFDKDFLNDPNMYYNICLDEMNREKNEKNSFDIVYTFVNQLENLVRSTIYNIRVICIGNTLEEASDILSSIGFIPETFGRYTLVKNKELLVKYIAELKKPHDIRDNKFIEDIKSRLLKKELDFGRRAVVEYIEPSERYLARRKGTVADILMPTASTFTNKIDVDTTLVTKKRLIKPDYVIQFTRDDKFTVWDSNVVCEYNGEKVPIVAMRPYLDISYSLDRVNNVIQLFDTRCYLFHNLITQKKMKKCLSLLKPRNN